MKQTRALLTLLLALVLTFSLTATAFAAAPTLVGSPTVQTDDEGREIYREEHYSDGSVVTTTSRYPAGTRHFVYYSGSSINPFKLYVYTERTVDTTDAQGGKTRRVESLNVSGEVTDVVTYALDAQGRIVSGVGESLIDDGANGVSTYSLTRTYNADGTAVEIVKSRSPYQTSTTVNELDANGLVVKSVFTANNDGGSVKSVTTNTYDADGNLTKTVEEITPPYDGGTTTTTTTIAYSAAGKVSSSVSESRYAGASTAQRTATSYNADGLPTESTRSTVDANGSATALSSVSYAYWDNGAPKSYETEGSYAIGSDSSFTTKYAYNEQGRVLTYSEHYEYSGGYNDSVETHIYGTDGLPVSSHRESSSSSGDKIVTDNSFNALGKIESAVTTYYNSDETVRSTTTNAYTYNALGKLLTQAMESTEADGTLTNSNRVENTYADDGVTLASCRTTNSWPEGSSTTDETFDAQGNLTRRVSASLDAAGAVISGGTADYTYNQVGSTLTRLATGTDAEGSVTFTERAEYAYADDGVTLSSQLLTRETGGTVHTDAITYNGQGSITRQILTETDAEGKVLSTVQTDYTYNDSGRMASRVTTSRDSSGTVTSTYEATYAYNADGRLIQYVYTEKDANGAVVSQATEENTFDSNGRQISRTLTVTDGSGQVTRTESNSYGYDENGRQNQYSSEYTEADGSGGRYSSRYDPSTGRQLFYESENRSADGSKEINSGTFDEAGRQLSRTYRNINADGSIAYSSETTYAYNDDGSYTQESLSLSSEGYTTSETSVFDIENRILSVKTESKDPDGNITDSQDSTYTYASDGSSVCHSLSASPDNSTQEITTSFDPQGNVLSVERIERFPNGEEYITSSTYRDGRLIHSVRDSAWADGQFTSHEETEFDDNGNEVALSYAQYENGELIYSYSSAISFNDDGSRTTHYTYPDGSSEDYTEWYTEDGRLNQTRRARTYADGSSFTEVTLYDAAGEASRAVSGTMDYYDADGQLTDHTETSYSYTEDADGSTTFSRTTHMNGDVNEQTYRYDSDGVNLSYEDHTIDAGGSSTSINYYDENGRTTHYTYDYTPADESSAFHSETIYDEQGRYYRYISVDTSSDGTRTREETRAYNDDGGYTETVVYTDIDGSQSTSIRSYDSDGNYLPQQLILPAGLTAVEAEAFSGSAAETVLVPASVQSIGANAFSYCWSLISVEFATASVDIDETAFDSSSSPTLIAPAGGTVEAFANAHGLGFTAK